MTLRARRRDLLELAHAATPGIWAVEEYDGGYLLRETLAGRIGVAREVTDARLIAAASPDIILRLLSGRRAPGGALRALHAAAADVDRCEWTSEGRWAAGPFGLIDVTAARIGGDVNLGAFIRPADADYVAALRPDLLLEVLP